MVWLLLALLMLSACSDAATPTVAASPSAIVTTATASPSITNPPTPNPSPTAAETTPPLAPTVGPTPTVPASTATPTTQALPTITATPTATFTPTLPPTATIPPTVTPTPTPSVTPGPNVPVQPVRRPGGILAVGLLEADFKARNYSPYAPDLGEVSQHLQRLTWNARLFYRDPVRLDWQPLAAQTLPTPDATGRRYTVVLRDDLTWSDGSPISSGDYFWAFSQALKAENRYPQFAQIQRIAELDVSNTDRRTLVFTFDARYANALDIIALIEPLPARVWSQYPFTALDRNPELSRPTVTSGPFRPDASGQIFLPSANYVFGRPNLDSLNLKTVKSLAELVSGLKKGSLGWTFNSLGSSALDEFQSSSNLRIYRWNPQDAARRYLGYNLNTAFLSSRAARQALGKALDLRSLIATVERDLGLEEPGFLPVGQDFALKPSGPPRFNIRMAREELKAAGFQQLTPDTLLTDRSGKSVPPLELIYSTEAGGAETVAIYVRQQYQQLGLSLKLTPLDPLSYAKRRATGQYDLDLGLSALPGALDPDDYRAQFVSRGALNFTGYANPEVDNLFNDGVRLDGENQKVQRRAVYERLQRIIADDAPVFFLYTLQTYTVMSVPLDPGGAGVINLPRWQFSAWDVFPAYLTWDLRDPA